jgi:PAS domain S-box-containing protein
VIRKETDLATVAALVDGHPCDVAIVAVGDDRGRALELIGLLARAMACPVIVLPDVEDPAFLRQAAERGVFAYLTGDDLAGARFESTIDIVRHRYGEYRGRAGAVPEPAGHTSEQVEAAERIEMLGRAEVIAGIGSYVWNIQTGELRWSDNLFRLFGLRPGALTPTPEYVLECIYPEDREHVRAVLLTAGMTGVLGMLEYRITRADGALRRLQASVASVEEADGIPQRLVGTVQDVTDRRQIARELAGHRAVEEVLATWVALDEDAERLLARVGEATGFSAGVLWLRRGDVLTAGSLWSSDPLDGPSFDAPPRLLKPGRGQALPVEAWLSREPVVVDLTDAPPFAGRDAAIRSGFRGALAFPAVSADEVFAVLEFYSREALQPTEPLLRSLTGMGYELGHFFARRGGELRPPELTARELEVLQLAAHGMTGKAIAHELTLSPSTVKTHFENIYAKWGVSDRASAVAKAMREGLIR